VTSLNDMEASLAANYLVHFIEQRIPSERLNRMSAQDLLDLYHDTLALVKGTMETREFEKRWLRQ